MAGDHVRPPADPVDAMLAMARLEDAGLAHLRQCRRCRIAWYRAGSFRAGCTEPRLGVAVLGAAGGATLPAAARAHVAGCLACRVLALDAARAMPAPTTDG